VKNTGSDMTKLCTGSVVAETTRLIRWIQ